MGSNKQSIRVDGDRGNAKTNDEGDVTKMLEDEDGMTPGSIEDDGERARIDFRCSIDPWLSGDREADIDDRLKRLWSLVSSIETEVFNLGHNLPI